MSDELPDIDEETVTVESVGDYTVDLDIDGLPNGTVAVDYYESDDIDAPRLLLSVKDVSVDLVFEDITVEDGDESGERVYAITINETSDLVEDRADRPNKRAE